MKTEFVGRWPFSGRYYHVPRGDVARTLRSARRGGVAVARGDRHYTYRVGSYELRRVPADMIGRFAPHVIDAAS